MTKLVKKFRAQTSAIDTAEIFETRQKISNLLCGRAYNEQELAKCVLTLLAYDMDSVPTHDLLQYSVDKMLLKKTQDTAGYFEKFLMVIPPAKRDLRNIVNTGSSKIYSDEAHPAIIESLEATR